MHDHVAAIEAIRQELRELHVQREKAKRAISVMYEVSRLTTIALNAELAQDDASASEELRENCRTIATEALRLHDLVHEVLDIKDHLEPFDVARIEALCAQLRPPTLVERVLHYLPGFRRG